MDDFESVFEKTREALYAEYPGLEFICCTDPEDTKIVGEHYNIKTYKVGDNDYYLIPLTPEVAKDFTDSIENTIYGELGIKEDSFEW